MGDYTQQMGEQILAGLNAPFTSENLLALHAWAIAEGGSAAYNPFDTTYDEPGSTDYNTFGDEGQYHVKNYPSISTGVDATVSTLRLSNYQAIVSALRAGTSADQVIQAIGSSPWGTPYDSLRSALATLRGDTQPIPVVKEIEPVDVLFIRCTDPKAYPSTLVLILGTVTNVGATSDMNSYVQMAKTTQGSYALVTVTPASFRTWLRKV